MTDPRLRDRILARRKQFLVAAMASAGVACTPSAGQGDASQPPVVVAVEPPAEQDDAGKVSGGDGEPATEAPPEEDPEMDPEPMPCLQPQMRPCLSYRPPTP
jgi:hypothetical protein